MQVTSSMVPVTQSDLQVGKHSPWTIYDKKGKQLINQGQLIHSKRQIDILIQRGFYNPSTTGTGKIISKAAVEVLPDSPFQLLEHIKQHLWQVLVDIVSQKKDDYLARITRIINVIQKLCILNADAALGALLLDKKSSYTSIHPILTTILCELISKKMGISSGARMPVLGAALTGNVGMFYLQGTLSRQKGPLNDIQKQAVHEHPQKSVELLGFSGETEKFLALGPSSWLT